MRFDLRRNLSFPLNISDGEESGSRSMSIMFSEAKNNNRSLSMARKKNTVRRCASAVCAAFKGLCCNRCVAHSWQSWLTAPISKFLWLWIIHTSKNIGGEWKNTVIFFWRSHILPIFRSLFSNGAALNNEQSPDRTEMQIIAEKHW